jgi:Putative amidoligase enzyme
MNIQVQNIIEFAGSKTAKIIALLELGMSRTQIADLGVLGKYGAIQNVFAKWQAGRNGNVTTRFSFMPTSFNKRFGIEIEGYGCNMAIIESALRSAGISCYTEGYNHNTRGHWKLVSDGSLSGDRTFELVSPILEGEAGLEAVRTVSNVLVRLGVKINRTCGLHAHLDAAGLNLTNWKNLISNYANLENVIDSMMPPSRRANQYCKTMKIENLTQKLQRCTTINQITNLFPNRYQKVNTQSYSRHGSVEFRQHSGTIESDKIVNWLIFLHNLLDYSKTNTIQNANFDTLKLFNQESIINFYHNRIQDLAA